MKDFINNWLMKTAMGMIGNRPDFYIRDYCTRWFERGKLSEADLKEVDAAIEARNQEPEQIAEDGDKTGIESA